MLRGFRERLGPQVQRPVGRFTGSCERAEDKDTLAAAAGKLKEQREMFHWRFAKSKSTESRWNLLRQRYVAFILLNHAQYSPHPVMPSVHRRGRHKCSKQWKLGEGRGRNGVWNEGRAETECNEGRERAAIPKAEWKARGFVNRKHRSDEKYPCRNSRPVGTHSYSRGNLKSLSILAIRRRLIWVVKTPLFP